MIRSIFSLRTGKQSEARIDQPDDQPDDRPDFTSEAAQRFHNWGVTR